MTKKSNLVYIIGFMGSGKTTTGKKLANYLGWSFIDLDRKIEEIAGQSIPEIFADFGEDYFRKMESQVLKSTIPDDDTVISTGGGTPIYEENMDFMMNSGLTIYLKLTPAQLKGRLLDSKGERPLIKGLSSSELLDFIKSKLEHREKWYNLAKLTVNGISVDLQQMSDLIKTNLGI